MHQSVPLEATLVRQGDWLFRWRGYLPFLGLPFLALELKSYRYPLDSQTWDIVLEAVCFTVAGAGVALRALVQGYAAHGTSGRNTRGQRALSLNTTGMYSLCRNPLYLGNYLICLGLLLFFHSIELTLIFTLCFWMYYERIIFREEKFLAEQFGDEFLDWARRIPVFVPRLRGWQSPERPFSFRTVVRRENQSVFMVIAMMTAFEVLGDWVLSGQPRIGLGWLVLLIAGTAMYVVLRFFKKHTRVLHEW